jgi:hypothetical protein
MPKDLARIDARLLGVWVFFKRDRGCYGATFDRLNVGVDGRRKFPGS